MSINTREVFDLSEHIESMAPRPMESAVVEERSERSERDAFRVAREEAIKYLNEFHRDAMLDPIKHRAEMERGISAAVRAAHVESRSQAEHLTKDLVDWIIGAGPFQRFLDDPEVTEIMAQGRDVYTERNGTLGLERPMASADETFLLAERMAQRCGVRFQAAQPIVDFAWLDGSRVHITHPVVSSKGTTITIRKPDRSRPLGLVDLAGYGMLTEEMAGFLTRAVQGRLNVIITGSTGAGKTTLLRAIAQEALKRNPLERLLVIEDTEELNLKHPHMIPFRAYTAKDRDEHGGSSVDVQELTKSSKRMRPDRVFLGEVRGPEAMDLLDLAQSEVGGVLSTIHIKSPELFVNRLFFIAKRSGFDLSINEMRQWVFETVDLIVHCKRDRSGHRHVSRIVELRDDRYADLWHWDPDARRHEKDAELSAERSETLAEEEG